MNDIAKVRLHNRVMKLVTLPTRPEFLPFKEARAFVHLLKLKNLRAWQAYSKSGKRPKNIPSNPARHYEEFSGFGNWLNTGTIGLKDRKFRPFKEARVFVRSLKLKSHTEWQAYCKSDKKPEDIPRHPCQIYTESFAGYGDWFGALNFSSRTRKPRPFKQAIAFAHSLKLKNQKEWNVYCTSGKKPSDIPSRPEFVYSEFRGYGNWLNTGNIQCGRESFQPFKETKRTARSLGLRSAREWKAWCKSERRWGTPSHPELTYKNTGWTTWASFLGRVK